MQKNDSHGTGHARLFLDYQMPSYQSASVLFISEIRG
jgi:hypothetical protein